MALNGRLGLLIDYVLGAAGWKPEIETTFKKLDALVQATAKSIANAPTLPSAAGDVYIVGASPAGTFAAAAANQLAYFDITNATWVFITPTVGFCVFLQSAGHVYTFVGGAWVLDPAVTTANNALITANNAAATANNAVNAVTNNFVSKTVTADQSLVSNLLAGEKSMRWGSAALANSRIDGIFPTFNALLSSGVPSGVYMVKEVYGAVADSPNPAINTQYNAWIVYYFPSLNIAGANVSGTVMLTFHSGSQGAAAGWWFKFALSPWKRLDEEVLASGTMLASPFYVTRNSAGIITQYFRAIESMSITLPYTFPNAVLNVQAIPLLAPFVSNSSVTVATINNNSNISAANGANNGNTLLITAVGF